MWIVIRLILAACGFAIRYRRRAKPVVPYRFKGLAYSEVVHRNRSSITGFTIGMLRRSPTWIRLHVESRADRLAKWLGVATESQTGDAAFDDRVYVTCDHPYVATVLAETPELRAAILGAFDAGFRKIRFDGQVVELERKCGRVPTPDEHQLLANVWRASARLEKPIPGRLADRFLWKALAVEGVIWSVLGYAIGATFELIVDREQVHVSRNELWMVGLSIAAISFGVLLGVITLWMRGSSRGHRIIVESALVLLLGLPVTSVQVVGDTNRGLDGNDVTAVTRRIVRCQVRVSSGKSRSTSYHLWTEPPAESTGPRIPRTIQITRPLCDAATPGGSVTIDVAPGAWGIAWFRQIRIGDARWSP